MNSLIAFVLTISCLLLSVHSRANESNGLREEGDLPIEELRAFTKVFEHIRNSYVEDIDDTTLLQNAIRGMLDGLDPHSTYLDASSFESLQVNTTGEFGGLGIEVGIESGFVKVISPIDDTPASRAGIEAGDLIIKIDEESVKGMSLSEAVERMRGPKDSEIILTIVREGEDKPIDMTLVRDVITVRSVRARWLEPGFAYLRIAQFQVNTGRDVNRELNKLKAEEALQGLILDLRNNPGGVLQASVEVVDNFLDSGLIVFTEGRIDRTEAEFEASPGDITRGVPMVVLINDGSASASEIVAGALQDHKRAIIVGTDSFGKGSVQTVIPLTEASAIKLTTALYFTPNGRSIQAQGIVPDIYVDRANVTSLESAGLLTTEAELRGHLSNANGEPEDSSASETRRLGAANRMSEDNQLFEALNLLKGLHIFSSRKELTDPKSLTADAAEAAL